VLFLFAIDFILARGRPLSSITRLKPISTGWVENGGQANDARISFRPVPWICLEGAAFAEKRIDLGADILDRRYPGVQ
jgi:hypothetical protein